MIASTDYFSAGFDSDLFSATRLQNFTLNPLWLIFLVFQ